ncbi:MAG: MoxR family ATPase [Pseudomonadota bacterium]
MATPANADENDLALADRLKDDYERVVQEIGKRIIGQSDVVELMLITLLAGGNSLLMGVPGLAKTLLVQTLAEALDLEFSRIQFTPDLMPSDITGTDLVQEDPDTGRRQMVFSHGPVFANIVLADEVNRTPPKTQSALLEAMQERRVTVQGKTYDLPRPFFVFATQNPIELEGTYPLPEAQLDRFTFEIVMDYLPIEEELRVIQQTTSADDTPLERIIRAEDLLQYQQLVRRVPLADSVGRYALNLVRATRPHTDAAADFSKQWLAYGASVRAAQFLVLGGKARALIHGRAHVGYEDVRALSTPVLRHRLLRNFQAEAEQIDTETIIGKLLEHVPTEA